MTMNALDTMSHSMCMYILFGTDVAIKTYTGILI